ncbi:MAG: hypothetical protein K9L30_03595 [Desulfobacterales bacterium]|nr:hypothetical protein [Desulfobacterales bacterium]
MYKAVKKLFLLFVIFSIVIVPIGTTAFAGNYQLQDNEITPEKVFVDAVLVRPFSFLATILGTVVFVVALPFSIPGGNTGEVFDNVVEYPAQYTFSRKVGDFSTDGRYYRR